MEIQTIEKGAELTSIIYKGEERLHDAKTFWFKHSPILFPIIGKLRYDKAKIDGVEYPIHKHGFGRDLNFEKIGEHSYVLKSSEETHKMYPYDFELYVWYTTSENKVTTNFRVVNKTQDKTMIFGLGGHPAFKCDYSNEKCYLEFEKEEDKVEIIPFELSSMLLKRENIKGEEFITDKKILKFNKDSFKNDAIILTNLKSKTITLKDGDKKLVKFSFDNGFNYLGIWSPVGAPFVCLEPWLNTADYVDSSIEFNEKKDTVKLPPNEEFKISFTAEFE